MSYVLSSHLPEEETEAEIGKKNWTKTSQFVSGRVGIQTRDCLVSESVLFLLLNASCMQMGRECRSPLFPTAPCPAGAWHRIALGK